MYSEIRVVAQTRFAPGLSDGDNVWEDQTGIGLPPVRAHVI